jgi:pyruvate-ferredoxin/flavodoxin oxidoreductase
MLSRHCQHAMAGGDGAEAGSGAKLALRHCLGLAEYFGQPRQQKFLDEIDSLRRKLADRIHQVLAHALPTSDLDALAEGLEQLGHADFELVDLARKVESATTSGRVDGAQLGRLVDVARGLADLQWHLERGPGQRGRARNSLTITAGAAASWAGAFPFNPFQSPVVIDSSGESGPMARGLLEGQIRQALAGFRLMRWAKLELEQPGEASLAAEAVRKLRFKDLTAEERRLCPPMIVVGDGQTLGNRGLATIAWLLDCDYPTRTIILSDIGGQADSGLAVDALGDYPVGGCFDPALQALLTRKAFVVQTSIAHPDHFAKGVLAALAFDGPALIHIHAPSPSRHGFPVERFHDQAYLAVQTRAFPLMIFDPSEEGVFGSCLDISANPEVESNWVRDENDRFVTPADWAATEERFAEQFGPLEDDAGTPTPVAEYIGMSASERSGKTPYVIVGKGEDEKRLRVGDILVADTHERLRLWRILQELAGVVTPFTTKVREVAERDLAKAHESALAKLRQEYEDRIALLRSDYETQATQRVTSGLMALAGYGAPDVPNEDGAS